MIKRIRLMITILK